MLNFDQTCYLIADQKQFTTALEYNANDEGSFDFPKYKALITEKNT